MKKDITYYMHLPYKLEIVEDPEQGYAAKYPELPGCITCGETISDTVSMAEEAKRMWLEACLEDGIEIPEPMKYSGQFKLRLPKTLHQELAETAELEGVSMNQMAILSIQEGLHSMRRQKKVLA